MEDRFIVRQLEEELSDRILICVFDGHNGAAAAERCLQNVVKFIQWNANMDDIDNIRATLKSLDDLFIGDVEIDEIGCTATIVLFNTVLTTVSVGNCGDSRAIVLHRDGKVNVLTTDHRPDSQQSSESKRIRALGGKVTSVSGVLRVNGNLNLTRSLGDNYMKPFISSEPALFKYTLTATEKYIVVGTDGLWDVVENKDVFDRLEARGRKWNMSKELLPEDENMAHELLKLAIENKTFDNTSIVVLELRDRGQVLDQVRGEAHES
jgi:protein phosphatase 2C